MNISKLLENKLYYFSTIALLIIPYYTWKTLLTSYLQEKRNYEEKTLFKKRHNCAVMYYPIRGMSGWPPNKQRIKPDINNLHLLYEPFVYFIETAEKTMDIAMMMISAKIVIDAILKACERGVKVRFLANFDHYNGKTSEINKLIAAGKYKGAIFTPYVSQKANMESIMHYKYMLKDYSENGGYVCMGSINITNNAFLNNYEDVVFTSEHPLVEAVYENFQECWKIVSEDNENVFNKAKLQSLKLC